MRIRVPSIRLEDLEFQCDLLRGEVYL